MQFDQMTLSKEQKAVAKSLKGTDLKNFALVGYDKTHGARLVVIQAPTQQERDSLSLALSSLAENLSQVTYQEVDRQVSHAERMHWDPVGSSGTQLNPGSIKYRC